MHLAIVCENLTPQDDAGEQARLLANAFVKRGHRVSLLCAVSVAADLSEDVELHSLGWRRLRWTYGLLAFRSWAKSKLRELGVDHTISMTTLVPADMLIPCTGTARGEARALRSFSAPPPARLGAFARSFAPAMLMRCAIEKRLLADPSVKAFVADNNIIKAELEQAKGIDRTRIESVAPPRVSEPLTPQQAKHLRQQLARGLNLSEDAAWLVFPFRLAWIAGLEPLMLAFKALVDQGADAVLLLAGPSRYTHLAWVAQLGLRDRVRFLGQPDRLNQLIAAADLVVQPTSHDPAGLAARIALTLSKPVVTTAGNGAAGWVREQGGCVLSPPVDPGHLARQLGELIQSARSSAPNGDENPPAWGLRGDARAEAIEALLRADRPSIPPEQA